MSRLDCCRIGALVKDIVGFRKADWASQVHFHLVPPSDFLLQDVSDLFSMSGSGRVTVVNIWMDLQ